MERLESKPTDFVGIAGPTLVYIGVAKRADFDKLALPCADNGENADGHVLTKMVGEFKGSEVTVIFQHWVKQKTIEAVLADSEARRASQLTPVNQSQG
jgi:hypothetical protein